MHKFFPKESQSRARPSIEPPELLTPTNSIQGSIEEENIKPFLSLNFWSLDNNHNHVSLLPISSTNISDEESLEHKLDSLSNKNLPDDFKKIENYLETARPLWQGFEDPQHKLFRDVLGSLKKYIFDEDELDEGEVIEQIARAEPQLERDLEDLPLSIFHNILDSICRAVFDGDGLDDLLDKEKALDKINGSCPGYQI